MYDKYNWRFDDEVVKIFDEHVRKSVPLYELFHKEISDISVYFSQLNTNVVDIGTSTGTLINEIQAKNEIRNCKYIGIDIEESMINECKNRYNNISFEVCDANEFDYNNSSIVTSMLAFQFINKKERVNILSKIYDGLNEDGVLFLVEKIKSNVPDIHDIYNDIYYDFKRNELSGEDILDKNLSLRGVMKPITLDENIDNLKKAGFKKIDVFMKFNNFVGIMAIK